ncbi:MAG: carbohydrate porin [Chthoniobacterales bacterium]
MASTPEESGVSFPLAFSTEIFGNFSGDSSRHVIWESLLRAGIEIDLEKAAGWHGFKMSLNGLYPQGSGLTSEAVHDFNTLSNIDGYDSVRLYEAWLEQVFADGKFSVRLGQILADAEFFSSDYGSLFMNSSFGAIPLISKNLNPPIFPVAAPGIRLRSTPSENFYAEAAFFSGEVGEPSTTNKHNTRLSFRSEDGVLIFFEIGYLLNPNAAKQDPSALKSAYKLGGFYDSGRFADVGGGKTHQGNAAVYFIIDQELWHPHRERARVLSFFSRIGGAPNDRNTVALYADTGLNFKGPIASRAEDIFGVGLSYVKLSDELVDDSGRLLRAHHEAVLEFTYQVAVRDHLSLQPDLQCIFNPGASAPAATAVVGGLRLNVKF